LRTLVASTLLALLFAVPLVGQGMHPDDRRRLIAHLEMTESWLVDELDGVSAEQLKFRMTPDSWSIMDVVEHLAIAEPQYWRRVQDSMKQPPTSRKSEVTDADILWYGIDRTNRERAVKADLPQGRWNDTRIALAEFRKARATMLQYARTTEDDLRSRRLLDGTMDVYQWFLMISTHGQRHILQIREIKAHPAYPRG
jgi:hypothetical protein